MLRRRTLMLLAMLTTCGLAHMRGYALPDAQLVRIEVQGQSYQAGDRVPVLVEVRNGGESPLPPTPVTLVVDDEPYADWLPPATLAPGESATWRLTYSGGIGMHLLVATVDPLNDVSEASYGNNSAFINLGLAERTPPVSPYALAAGIAAFVVGLVAGVLLRRTPDQTRHRR